MKPQQAKWLGLVSLSFIMILSISWKNGSSSLPVKPYNLNQNADTTPAKTKNKKEYRSGDIDNAMKDLDKAMLEMDKNMKVDMVKMDKEIKQAMEEVKKVDYQKIMKDVKEELSKVDWAKMQKEVQQSIQEAMKEVQTELKKVDMKEIQKEIEKAQKEVNMEKIKVDIDIEKIQKEVHESLANAKSEIAKAKTELSLLKEFTLQLEKDGLIDKKKGYKIEIKSGELYINGTKQSKESSDKYKKYFKKDDYSISSDGNEVDRL